MLKQVISLFCEKFLQNKSEYIGQQAFPSKRVNLDVNTGYYIPPSDGYIGFYKSREKSATGIDVFAYGSDNANIVSRTTISTSIIGDSFLYSQTIPVKKGCKVVINYGAFSELWFSPSVGSKQ